MMKTILGGDDSAFSGTRGLAATVLEQAARKSSVATVEKTPKRIAILLVVDFYTASMKPVTQCRIEEQGAEGDRPVLRVCAAAVGRMLTGERFA